MTIRLADIPSEADFEQAFVLACVTEDAAHLRAAGYQVLDMNTAARAAIELKQTMDLENFKGVKKIIVAFPENEFYNNLADEVARRLGKVRCWRVIWPKDSAAFLIGEQQGQDALKALVDAALPWPIEGIFQPSKAAFRIYDFFEHGLPKGSSTGFKRTVDLYYTVRPGEWTLVTGHPSHGKSEYVDAVMMNLAAQEDWKIAIFSPENLPFEMHVSKLLEKYFKKPFGAKWNSMTKDEIAAGMKFLDKNFHFIMPETPTLECILDRAAALVAREGIKGLCIDPYNEIDHTREAYFSETEYISRFLSRLRKFARENDVHVWLVAHPTKLQKDKVTGKYPVATPWDVAGSAHFRNKADCCLSIWRDVEDSEAPVQVHVQKVRFKSVGRPGVAELRCDFVRGCYYE